jgi:DNA-binding NtrC family response regulator
MASALADALSPTVDRDTPRIDAPDARALLVVDDQEGVIAAIDELFRGRYRVLGAHNVEEALEILRHGGVAVVMADQRMPRVSGSELLAQIASFDPDVTRILMTGYPDIDAVMQAINQGKIYYYVAKPWDPSELEAIIDKAFEYHDLLRERRRLVAELQQANDALEAKVLARTEELR